MQLMQLPGFYCTNSGILQVITILFASKTWLEAD